MHCTYGTSTKKPRPESLRIRATSFSSLFIWHAVSGRTASSRSLFRFSLKTPGVCRFVACAGRPVVIPFSEIEGVRRIVESTLSVEPHPFLRRGDCVRIKFGPLAGLEGILVRKGKRACLVISVEMLGRSGAVEVDEANVERIVDGNLWTRSELEGRFVSSRANRPAALSPAAVG